LTAHGCGRRLGVVHRILLTTAILLAVAASAASAKTFSAQEGGVQATITYTQTSATNLTITRNGATLFNAAPKVKECGDPGCAPSGFAGDPALRVLDLDGNGEPEVVYSAYSGGAHCCSIAQVYRFDGTAYTAGEHNFWDPGFRLKDLNGDGIPEWLTGDDAFAYRFTAYAFSGLPVQIFRWSAGKFTNATKSFPAQIKSDAKRWLSIYKDTRHRKDGTEFGAAAAWAADQYHLGKRAAALRYLRRETRAGRLKGPGAHGLKFVKTLDRFLRKRGYR
jgi:hypothetical protein